MRCRACGEQSGILIDKRKGLEIKFCPLCGKEFNHPFHGENILDDLSIEQPKGIRGKRKHKYPGKENKSIESEVIK